MKSEEANKNVPKTCQNFFLKLLKIDRKGFVCVALQDLKSGTLIKIIKERPQILVLGQTGFMGSEFGIFGGF